LWRTRQEGSQLEITQTPARTRESESESETGLQNLQTPSGLWSITVERFTLLREPALVCRCPVVSSVRSQDSVSRLHANGRYHQASIITDIIPQEAAEGSHDTYAAFSRDNGRGLTAQDARRAKRHVVMTESIEGRAALNGIPNMSPLVVGSGHGPDAMEIELKVRELKHDV
jgi:hypothetical protein